MATVAAGDGRLTNLTNVILTGTDDRTLINDMTQIVKCTILIKLKVKMMKYNFKQ